MNKKNLQSRLLYVLPTMCVVALSSCNRGVGCPTNFSIDTNVLLDLAVSCVQFFF